MVSAVASARRDARDAAHARGHVRVRRGAQIVRVPGRRRDLRHGPGDPAATNLRNWALFEADNPDTFTAMYQFWIQKAVNH